MNTSRITSLRGFGKAALAALLVALLFLSALASASPALHDWLHKDHHTASHYCLVTALEHGQSRLALRLKVSHAQRDALIDDASGDRLDAVLCLMQAAWAAGQGAPLYGLPPQMDPLEGWIVTARRQSAACSRSIS